jgi:hypothetical protein
MDVVHAASDLNGVTRFQIRGWKGHTRVVPLEDGGTWVQIEVPKRAASEHWTFGRVGADGTKTCFSSLLASPDLMGRNTLDTMTMVVRVPQSRISDLRIDFS